MGSWQIWVFGFLALLITGACMKVGLLYSILIIGTVCGVLYWINRLVKNASKSEQDRRNADLSIKIVTVIAIGLMCVAGLFALIGLVVPADTGYQLQTCGYCGGSGRLSSGKACGVCDGAGGAAYESAIFGNSLWFGILGAAAGGALYVGVILLKEGLPKTKVKAAASPTVSKPMPQKDPDTIPASYTTYMQVEKVELHPDLPEYSSQVWGPVLRGSICGQQIVNVKSHTSGETVKFKVAGEGLKGKAGDQVRLRIYVTGGGRLKVAVGDSVFVSE